MVQQQVEHEYETEHQRPCSGADVVGHFYRKGWAPYAADEETLRHVPEEYRLTEIIMQGKASDLEEGQRYILLPYLEEASDVGQVVNAFGRMHKMPMFHELPPQEDTKHELEQGRLPPVYGIHPIESFVFSGTLQLIIDKRLYELQGVPDTIGHLESPYIEIDNPHIPDAIRYCINRYRTREQVEKRLEEYNLRYTATPSDTVQ